MDRLSRIGLIYEFEKYLKERYQYQKEVRYCDIMDTDREFRADYLLMDNEGKQVLVEINGGQHAMRKKKKNGTVYYTAGRHNKGGKGYENDLVKLNTAQKNGFPVFQFTYEMLSRKEYINYL